MFKFAIKNILRYRSRSMITLIVIAFSAFATVITVGMTGGVMDHMINGFIQYDTAHIRISTKEFQDKERFSPIYANIEEAEKFKQELLSNPEIERAVPTFRFGGLVGVGDTTIPLSIVAFDLNDNGFDLESKLVEGQILERGVLIGTKLQEKLNVVLNDTVLIASTTTEDGLNATKPKITAFTHFGISQFDKHTIIMDLQTAERLLRAKDKTTELFITLKNEKDTDKMTQKLQELYPDYAVSSYKEQIGSLYVAIEMERKVIYFIGIILMLFGSFVITNSLIASIYERMHEIGMLKAIGFTNGELTKMLFWEGITYGVIGGGVGFLMGVLMISYLSQVGIDFSASMGDMDIPMSAVIYPNMSPLLALINFFIAIFIPALVSLIPAKIIKNITPIEALSSRG